MPWWAWLLVDLLLLFAAAGVVARVTWVFVVRAKAFTGMLVRIREQLPQVERTGR